MGYVEIRGLAKQFTAGQQVVAVRDFNLTVRRGEFVTLLGPSGCGKTTTLRCVAGLERPDGGTIAIDGQTVVASPGVFVPPHKREVGMVFQSYAIWPHMTVAENVAYPLEVRRVPRHEREKRVARALELVGLGYLGHRYPSQLSGGQQQRVALARALVAEPKVLLLDEPLSNLDAKLRERMRQEILTLRNRVEFTAIYVTHDQTEALTMSDRVVVMNQGHIQQVGIPAEIYERPVNQFVADFIGATNLVAATVRERCADGRLATTASFGEVLVADPGDHQPGARVLLSIRPEALHLCPEGAASAENQWPGEVTIVSFAGPTAEYAVRLRGQALRGFTLSKHAPRVGEQLTIAVTPQQVVLFPAGEPA